MMVEDKFGLKILKNFFKMLRVIKVKGINRKRRNVKKKKKELF
jgi:hypothetical protein